MGLDGGGLVDAGGGEGRRAGGGRGGLGDGGGGESAGLEGSERWGWLLVSASSSGSAAVPGPARLQIDACEEASPDVPLVNVVADRAPALKAHPWGMSVRGPGMSW